MKYLTITFFFSVPLSFFAQDKIAGRYRDYFGNRIRLDTDHTFKCTWNFDMVASWTKGTWTLRNDNIYFSMIPTYDTLSYTTPTGSTLDSLILSTDEISERIIPEQSAVAVFYSGGQNRMAFPDKLLFRKGRLCKILDGKVVVKSKKALGQVKNGIHGIFRVLIDTSPHNIVSFIDKQ